jgi:hypothetical protein
MKTLKLDISLEGLNLNDDDKVRSPSQLCGDVIKNVIVAYGVRGQNRGLTEEERRKFYKISDILEKAEDSVELEDDWMGFIRKCFKETPLIPDKLLRRVEEKIEEVKDR